MTELLIKEIPLGNDRLREFVELPWRLYNGDPFWTPLLNAEYLGRPALMDPRRSR